jgi:hypothetical protein
MKFSAPHVSINKLKVIFSAFTILGVAVFSSCSKQNGYSATGTKVTSVIQINANTINYSIASTPDIISFSTTAVNAATPNFREYLVKGITTNSSVSFSLAFHIDSIGSGKYLMEGSQLIIGTKSYISLAAKSTDKVTVTKLDTTNKIYNGTFSFYSFNQSSSTDSVLVTGTYSIQ